MTLPDRGVRSLPARAALAAAGWLVMGGLVLPFALAFGAGLTGLESSPVEYLLAAIIVLAGASLAGAAFGRRLAGLTGIARGRRMAWAGALSYGPAAIISGIVLGFGEPVALGAVQRLGMPIHVLFALMFVPAVFCVVAVTALAFGVALRSRRVGVELAVKAGLVAAFAFLTADVIQHLLGRRVGGPDAAATATMVTVTLVGALASAAAAGAVMATILLRQTTVRPSAVVAERTSEADSAPAASAR